MKKKSIEGYLGLARRAGRVMPGYKSCAAALGRGQIRLIIAAEDVSDKTKQKFETLCHRYGADFAVYGTIESLSEACGYGMIGIYGITDKEFSRVMMKEIRNAKITVI